MAWGFKRANTNGDDKNADEQSKAEMDALVERLGSSLEERIAKPLGERIDKLQSEWEAVKTEATRPPAADNRPKNPDGTPRDLTEEEKIKLGLQTNYAANVLTNARITENAIIADIAASWPDQVPEIRKYLSEAPIAVKGRDDYEGYCRNIVDMVIGRAAQKNGFRYDGQAKTFFLEDKSTSSTQQDGVLSDPSLKWEQRDANGNIKRTWTAADQLRALDIDPEQFAKNVKEGVV